MDILRGEFDKRVFDSLDRTVHIGFDDDIEFLKVSDSQTTTNLFEADVFLRADGLLALKLLTLVGDVACFLLRRDDVELITGLRRTVETEDRTGFARTHFGDLLSALVEHRFDTTVEGTCEDDVAHMQRTVLHEQRSYVAAAFVKRRLDDRTFGTTFRVRLEVEHLGLEQHFLEQLIHARSFLRGDLLALVFTAPVLNEDVHVTQLLADLIGVRAGFVDLVDGEDHRHTCGLRVVNRLDGLRHDGVVGSDDDDRDIRHFRTTCTHGREGRVTRSIEESDMLTVLEFDVVRTDVLGDTTGLTGDHIRVSDVVEERSLTVIDVSHDGDDRATGFHILLVDHFISVNLFYHVCGDVLGGETELLGYEVDGLGVEALVDGDEKAEGHTRSDDLIHRHVHHHSQVVRGHKLREFQHFGLLLCLHLLEFVLLTLLLAALAFILRGVGLVLFLLQTAERLLQCLFYLFLRSLTRFVTLVLTVLTRLVSLVVRIHFRGVVLDTLALALLGRSLLLSLLRLLTLLTLFAFLLFGLLGRTRRGIDGVEVDLSEHFRSVLQFGFAKGEDLFLRLLGLSRLHRFCGLSGFCALDCLSRFLSSLFRRFLSSLSSFGRFLFRYAGSLTACSLCGSTCSFLLSFGFCLGFCRCARRFFFGSTLRSLTIRLYLHRHVLVELLGEQQVEVVGDAEVRIRLDGMVVLLTPSGERSHTYIQFFTCFN